MHMKLTMGQEEVRGNCMLGSRLEALCVGAAVGTVLLSSEAGMKVPAERGEEQRR